MGFGEILLILIVTLLLFGSKNLPKTARTIGRALEEFRRAARDVSNQILHADEPGFRPRLVQKPPERPPEKPAEKKDGAS